MKYDKDYGIIVLEKGYAPGPSSILKRRRVLDLLKSFKPGKVIEVGCGAGAILYDVSNLGFECSAIETSDKAREIARYIQQKRVTKFQVFSHENPDWIACFDYVFSFDVLEHIEADDLALVKWAQWLKSKGYIFLTVPMHVKRWGPDDVAVGHFRRYERMGLEDKLQKSGFEILHYEFWGFPLSNMIRPLRNRKYKAIMKAHEKKGLSREEGTALSGIERSAEAKLLIATKTRNLLV
jgi:SAM-dependent methyltransferase